MSDWMESPAAKSLIAKGLMDESTGATRRAKAARCGRCRRVVMRGIGAEWGGYVIDADPEPLSRLGEALALMAGRRSVSLSWTGDRYVIDTRDQFRIRGSPAGTIVGTDILVVHNCELTAGHLPHMDSMMTDVSPSVSALPSDPPF